MARNTENTEYVDFWRYNEQHLINGYEGKGQLGIKDDLMCFLGTTRYETMEKKTSKGNENHRGQLANQLL